MSRNSAIIKFGYSHRKEYDDEKAGNKKHSAKCKFCPTPITISDRSGTTSSFVRHMKKCHGKLLHYF